MPDPLFELAHQHHPVELMGAGLFAQLCGHVDRQGQHRPPLAVHIAEHAHLVLASRPALWQRSHSSGEVVVADFVDAAMASIALHERDDPLRTDLTGAPAIFNSPHARLSAGQLLWWDPVLVEAEVARTPELLVLGRADIEAVAQVTVEQWLAVWHTISGITPRWLAGVLGLDRACATVAELVGALREIAEGEALSRVPGQARPAVMPMQQVAEEAGVEFFAVQRFCEILGHRIGSPLPEQGDGQVSEPGYLERLWHLRRRPVIELAGGVCVAAPYNMVMAARTGLEDLLHRSDEPAWQRYEQAKGKWVERRASKVLADALGPDEQLRSLRIPAPAGERPERDGLLRIDTLALAVEVKGGGLPPTARQGVRASQDRTFERLIKTGARQATSLAQAVQVRADVTGIDSADRRVTVDFGDLSRALPMVITLEDVSAVTARGQLVLAASDGPQPWIVSLDELQWYSGALPGPAALVHYAILRARLGFDDVAVLDEGDWFRLYHALGAAGMLAFVADMSELARQVVLFGGDLRRGRNREGMPVWRSPLQGVVERLEGERPEGWLEAAITSLDLSEGQANGLLGGIKQLHELTDQDTFPMMTVRPWADEASALHIFAPARGSQSVRYSSLADWATKHAADARRHVFLAALTGEPHGLQVGPLMLARTDDKTAADTSA